MASLKDTVISGSLRVTDTTYTNDLILGKTYTARYVLAAPTTDGVPSFRALTNADVGLGNVENTKLSTWTGANTIKTVGTITTGTWNATVIGTTYGGTGVNSSSTAINKVFASPGSGSAGAPSFRTLVAADVPAITTASDTTNELYMLGVTSSATTTVKYNSGVKAKNGAVTATTYNGLTLTAASTGFTIAGGTTSKTLTVSNSYTLGAACTHGVNNRTTVSSLTDVNTWAASTNLTTDNLIKNWDGRYQKTDNLSNLTYLNKRVNFPTITGGTGVTAADNGSGSSPRYRPASWKFNASITPIDGDVVTVKKPSALHDYGTWLSLDNGTTWYPIVYANTSRVPDWFNNNYSITLRFDAVGTCSVFGAIDTTNKVMLATDARSTITGVWRLWTMYDSGNTNDTGTLVRDYGGNVAIVTTTTTLYRYQLLFSAIDTNYGWKGIPANTTSNSTGTSKTTIFTGEFNPFGDILYYSHTDTVNANATVRADRIWRAYPITLSYSFNCGSTLTASKDVYVVAYLTGPCKAKLRNPGATGTNAAATATGANAGPITQTLPTSADGYIYIRLGRAYNSSAIDVSIEHPIYYHDGVAIRLLAQSTSYGTTLPANGREGQTFFQVSDPWYELPPGGTAGQTLIKASNSDRDVTWGAASGGGTLTLNNTTKYYVCGSTSNTTNANGPIFNTSVYVDNSKLFGAAWNDYAEKRKCDNLKPGTCVIENDDGKLSIAIERLTPGACIISDTYGMCIGETEEAKTPIAITGRVLAYTYQPRENYHAGMAVCSAPDGTIDIMTRKEIRDYPDAIIGIVSEIPDYEYWGTGNIQVNNRIWIKIK